MMNGPSRLGNGQPDPAATGALATATLEVAEAGRFVIEGIATIGRGPACDIVLKLRSVSRNHARVFFEGGHFWIKDLDSANGTTVNGKRIKLQMLGDNDSIAFGEVAAVFHTSVQPFGPALLAQDPLEGAEHAYQDGTPTGQLLGSFPYPGSEKPGVGEGTTPIVDELKKQLERITAENESLRQEIAQFRGGGANVPAALPDGSALEVENARLKRLVAQLERALADSNLRLRNLQARLDPIK
jgi:hypothetical protein